MTTIICSTESVDTSAVLLAQTLDNVLFTKETLFPEGQQSPGNEITEALIDDENQVVFYGIVPLNDWFIENVFDSSRMFNDPSKARSLLSRTAVITALEQHNIKGLKYYRIREGTNFTQLRERYGRRFDLVVRAGMTITHTVDNAAAYNEVCNNVHFACAHVEPVKRIRAFMGSPSLTDGGLIGVSIAEKRQLTFFEQLTYGSSSDVRQHIAKQFEDGILTEAMIAGPGQIAWTEDKHTTADTVDEGLVNQLKNIAQTMYTLYELDFWSIDAVIDREGNLIITNMTASPSLQNDDVLEFVSNYYKKLLAHGRKISKETLLEFIHNLSEDQANATAETLKREGLLITTYI